MFRFVGLLAVLISLLFLASGCMHHAPSMVKGQLKTDRKTHTPIVEKIQAYKFQHGQYPLTLADLSLEKKYPSKRAIYQRYIDKKSDSQEGQFRYRINTSWRLHAGHCIYDSKPNKWRCDDYPTKAP